LKDNTTISQLQTDKHDRLKLRFAKLKPVRGSAPFNKKTKPIKKELEIYVYQKRNFKMD
jgi:hypothetical protein